MIRPAKLHLIQWGWVVNKSNLSKCVNICGWVMKKYRLKNVCWHNVMISRFHFDPSIECYTSNVFSLKPMVRFAFPLDGQALMDRPWWTGLDWQAINHNDHWRLVNYLKTHDNQHNYYLIFMYNNRPMYIYIYIYHLWFKHACRLINIWHLKYLLKYRSSLTLNHWYTSHAF